MGLRNGLAYEAQYQIALPRLCGNSVSLFFVAALVGPLPVA